MIRGSILLSLCLAGVLHGSEPRRVTLSKEELDKEIAKPETPPLLRVTLDELDKRLGAAMPSKDAAPRLVESILKAAWMQDGKGGYLAGEGVWRFRSPGGQAASTLVEPMQLALRGVRWEDGKDARMTVAEGGNGPALKLFVPADGALRFNWSAAGTREPGEIRLDLQIPACAVSTLELELPRDLRPFTLQEAILAGPFPARSGNQAWRFVLSGQSRLVFSIRPLAEVGLAPVRFRSDVRQIVAASRVNHDFDLELDIGRAGVSELLADFDAALSIQEVAINNRRDWTVEGSPIPGRKRLRVRFLEPTRGGRLQIRATGPLPAEDAVWTSPALAVVHGLPLGESLDLRVGPEWREDSFQPGAFRVKEDWKTLSDGTRAVRLESAFVTPGVPPTRPTLRRVVRGGEFEAKQNLVWRTGAERMSLEQEIELRVLFGTVGQLVVRVPTGWEVERVALPGSELPPEWAVRNGELSIDPVKGWNVGMPSHVEVRYRHPFPSPDDALSIPAPLIKGARTQTARLAFAPERPLRFLGGATGVGPPEEIGAGTNRAIEWGVLPPAATFRLVPPGARNVKEPVRLPVATKTLEAEWISDPSASLTFDGSENCRVVLRGNLRPGSGGRLELHGWHPDSRLLSVSFNRRPFLVVPPFTTAGEGKDLLIDLPAELEGLYLEIHYETPVERGPWSAVARQPLPYVVQLGKPVSVALQHNTAAGWHLAEPTANASRRIVLSPGGEIVFRRGNPLLWILLLAGGGVLLYAIRTLPRRAAAALCGIALLGGTLAAAPDEPVTVFIVPSKEGVSAYVPADWWNNPPTTAVAAPQLVGAAYSAWVRDGTLELAIGWDVHTADVGAVFPFNLPEARLRSMTCDGKVVYPRPLGADRYEVDLPEAGTRRLRLVVDVPVAEKSGERECRFAIPEHPASRCAFLLPPEAKSLRFGARRGGVRAVPTPLGLCVIAELGRARAFQPAWGGETAAAMDVREAHLAEIETDTVTLTSAWECGKPGVPALRAKLQVPAEWEPVRVEIRSDAPTVERVLDWRLGQESNGFRDLNVDLAVDAGKGFRLVVECVPARQPSRRLTLRPPQWPEAATRDAWLGYRLKGWEAHAIEPRLATEIPVEPNWKESCRGILGATASQTPDRLFRRSPKGTWSIRLDLKEPPPVAVPVPVP